MNIWVYFLTLNFVPLIYTCILMSVSKFFDYCFSAVSFEVEGCERPLHSISSFLRAFWLVGGGGGLVANSCPTLVTPAWCPRGIARSPWGRDWNEGGTEGHRDAGARLWKEVRTTGWILASVLRELRGIADFERKRSLSALTF